MNLTPSDFTPRADDPKYFVQGVVAKFGYYTQPRNPVYCGTAYTAGVMKQILAQFNPKIVQKSSLGQPLRGGWVEVLDDMPVTFPWLDFGNGYMENVGLLANYWTHGYPLAWLEQEVVASVQQMIDAAQGV